MATKSCQRQMAPRPWPWQRAHLLLQHKDAVSRKLEKKVRQLKGEAAQRDQLETALHESEGLMRIAGRMARLGGWSVSLADMRTLWSDEVEARPDTLMASGRETVLIVEDEGAVRRLAERFLESVGYLAT